MANFKVKFDLFEILTFGKKRHFSQCSRASKILIRHWS